MSESDTSTQETLEQTHGVQILDLYRQSILGKVATLRRVLDEEGLDQPLLGGRQHFLRRETPTTARLWDDNGLDDDTTLSYADRPGFRCGTCRP